MKTMISLAFVLAVAASSLAAQTTLPTKTEPRDGGSVVARVPDKDTVLQIPHHAQVTSISSRCYYEEGTMTIEGRNLGMIWNARVNGLNVPIVHQTATEIVIEPGYYDPGFYPVELSGPHGMLRAPWAEFTPSLTVRKRLQQVEVTVHPGEAGFYWVYYSYDDLGVPLNYPGIHYMQMLDMTSPRSGLLAMGHVESGADVVLPWTEIPPYLGLIRPLKLQAFFQFDEGGEMCFTNMVKAGFPVYFAF